MSARDKTYGSETDQVVTNLLQSKKPVNPLSEEVFNQERESYFTRQNREGNLIFVGMVGDEKALSSELVNQITSSWRLLADFSFEPRGEGKPFATTPNLSTDIMYLQPGLHR